MKHGIIHPRALFKLLGTESLASLYQLARLKTLCCDSLVTADHVRQRLRFGGLHGRFSRHEGSPLN